MVTPRKMEAPVSARDTILDEAIATHPRLHGCRGDIESAAKTMCASYRKGGKLLVCGNGGSAADAEHIVGELMKGFRLKRPLPPELRARFADAHPSLGPMLADSLQGALPAIALTGHASLSTAFANDVDPLLVFAQQVYGYGRTGDVLLGLTTSGNSKNVLLAVVAARALGLTTIGLTGAGGGELARLCDLTIKVPETETARVQELHLPVYHALCTILEAELFHEAEDTD